ncbi:hypothetical protein M409DRAFT_25017 [Zasmidium cellare ATCC 36951]|uniref:Rhodopsin domain-containing protein n=1 Tax=Zasmidium cellare ATCC 36951 TaxID=1080233 RepID=A0A6A6CEG5_ZASCE|nr:uncharacterized protein M409DRAFT_25017 [Zasmidium cellare ATCC 36951]KAF2164620.1 hypothetical protein M409DRAFT_25017 [Zasmidium cellare ATCC 36951]
MANTSVSDVFARRQAVMFAVVKTVTRLPISLDLSWLTKPRRRALKTPLERQAKAQQRAYTTLSANMSTTPPPTTNPSLWTTTIPNKTPVLIIVSTVFLFLSTGFFLARFLYRWRTHQRGWDDLMALLAYLTLAIQTAFLYASATHGFGKHRADLPRSEFSKAMFYFYLYQICYKIIGGFTKLNFCFLYLRIFGQSKGFAKVVNANSAIIAAGTVAFTVGTVFQCVPVKRNWDRRVAGYCISNMGFWYAHAGFNTLMDIVVSAISVRGNKNVVAKMMLLVFCLPLFEISKLHTKLSTKISVGAIFVLGFFTIAASIVRMAMLYHSAKSTDDPTWGSLNGWLWTEIEANTAVICCCLPALRNLFVQGCRILRGKSGPETPTNTQNITKSQTRRLIRREEPTRPTQSRAYGNFSEAKYCPPGSTQNLAADISKPTRAWFSQPFHYHRKSGSGSSDTELTKAEEGGAGIVLGSTAPRLDTGSIYKTMAVDVQSKRDSRFGQEYGYHLPEVDEGRKGEEEISLSEILRER